MRESVRDRTSPQQSLRITVSDGEIRIWRKPVIEGRTFEKAIPGFAKGDLTNH